MQYHAIAEIKGTVFGTYNYPLAITQTGTFINSRGGWLAYLAQQEKEQRQQEQRQTEAHQATLDSAKATEDSAQFASASAKAAWFSGIFGAVAVFLTLYQMWKGNETDKELNVVKKQVVSIDSLMKVQRQNQTTNGPKGYPVLSDSSVRQVAPGAASPVTGSTPVGSQAAQPNEGVKVGATFVVWSCFLIHQPSWSLGGGSKNGS